MFRSSQEQPSHSKDGASYEDALRALRTEVTALEINVQRTQNALQDEYTKEALVSLAGYFEGISARFIRYRRENKSLQFAVISRSDSRKHSADRVISSAKATAKLFERYARNPKAYSRVESRLKIDVVLADLSTLKSYC